MKNISKVIQTFGPFQSKNLRKAQANFSSQKTVVGGSFINEGLADWPSWTQNDKKQEEVAVQGKKKYTNAISYQLTYQIPKIRQISRCLSKSFTYYVDSQSKLVYFYPNYGGYNLKKLSQKPKQEELLKQGYNSPANYQSIKVVPLDYLIQKMPTFKIADQ